MPFDKNRPSGAPKPREGRPGAGDSGTTPPSPGRRLPLILIIGAILLLALFQSMGSMEPRDAIRYDQLKHYVEEGRVQWVHLTPEQITGRYKQGRKPAAAPEAVKRGRSERPDMFATGRVDDKDLVPLLEKNHVAFRAVPSPP